jgi:glycosyltransferase involved in cell wall biosynthesis
LIRWAILTGEYPPDPGGVSDYSRLIARELVRAGDAVQVFAPPPRSKPEQEETGVRVHRLPGRFGARSLRRLRSELEAQPRPDRCLVQYVPHAFGFKAMNLPFAMWVALRLRRIAPVWVMFHEVASTMPKWPPRHTLLGVVTRLMARNVAGAAERVFVSIPAWATLLKRLAPRAKAAEWLPVPCNVATSAEPAAIATIRERYLPRGGLLVGHFGTFGGPITDILTPTAIELLGLVSEASMLMIGRGSGPYRAQIVASHPELAGRVHATGELGGAEVAAALRACDVVLQPYPDGISARRGSAMAAIANGLPVVTNLGALSEPLWAEGAVSAAPGPDPMAMARLAAGLLCDPHARTELGHRAVELYRAMFSVERTIARLRSVNP